MARAFVSRALIGSMVAGGGSFRQTAPPMTTPRTKRDGGQITPLLITESLHSLGTDGQVEDDLVVC